MWSKNSSEPTPETEGLYLLFLNRGDNLTTFNHIIAMTKFILDVSSGLFCVAVISRLHGVPLGTEQLKHQFNTSETGISALQLARIFTAVGSKATVVEKDISRLAPALFPVVAELQTGEFVVLAKYKRQDNTVLVQRSGEERAGWLPMDALRNQLSGKLVLVQENRGKDEKPQDFGLL